jgi:hypothetical protein
MISIAWHGRSLPSEPDGGLLGSRTDFLSGAVITYRANAMAMIQATSLP